MTKIVSRVSGDAARIERLQEILTGASNGVVGDVSNGAAVQIADNLDELIEQTDTFYSVVLTMLADISTTVAQVQSVSLELAAEVDTLQDRLANLIGNIDYDEALDHATADLMDCFCTSGSADVSANGELVFSERIVFTKEDLKPMLREAIVRWIELKLGE